MRFVTEIKREIVKLASSNCVCALQMQFAADIQAVQELSHPSSCVSSELKIVYNTARHYFDANYRCSASSLQCRDSEFVGVLSVVLDKRKCILLQHALVLHSRC